MPSKFEVGIVHDTAQIVALPQSRALRALCGVAKPAVEVGIS